MTRYKLLIESDVPVQTTEGTLISNISLEFRGSPAWAAHVIDHLFSQRPEVLSALSALMAAKLIGAVEQTTEGVVSISSPGPGDTIN